MRFLAFGSLLLCLAACDTAAPPVCELPPGGTAGARVAAARLQYPLRVAAGGRTLEDASGTPVLLQGDAAWSLVVNLRREEVDHYLADRKKKGFNAIYVNLIEPAYSNQTPRWRNAYGEDPFTGTVRGAPGGPFLDLSTPNEAYWRHVDDVLDRADAAGIVVVAFPAYTGWQQGDEGWAHTIDVNGPERLRQYGLFLGRRYADQPNLIWSAGGDWGPRPRGGAGRYNLVDEYSALAAGIRATDCDHLWTGHGGQESGADVYGYLGLDLNTTYRYPPQGVPDAVYQDYVRAPALPFVFFEGWYENEYDVSPAALRYQAYTSLLGGAAGQFYGNSPVWKFSAGWEAALDDPGAQDQVHVGDLFRSRPFHRLVPDYGNATVTSDRGRRGDGSYVAAARADDGSTVIVYSPRQQPVEVDLSRVSGSEVRAWCFDPATGVATDLGRFPTTGRRTAPPCAAPDWALVLDDAGLNLPPPGTER